MIYRLSHVGLKISGIDSKILFCKKNNTGVSFEDPGVILDGIGQFLELVDDFRNTFCSVAQSFDFDVETIEGVI